MGHAAIDLIQQRNTALCLNGMLNFVIGMVAMVALIYLQLMTAARQ